MIDQPAPTQTDLLDYFSLNQTCTELLPEHFQKAARLSKTIHLPQQRWQVYLCALGVLGFEQWLKERAPDLHLQQRSASIWQPAYANLLVAACNISVGNFKLCLITSNNLTEEHSIPFAVFDIPEFAAHFYVLMQVEEEQEQVAVTGFINYEQYQKYKQSAQLQIDSDWTYTLPSTAFNPPDALLLNLRCLETDAIKLPLPLPAVENNTTTALRQKLTQLEPQLQTQHPSQLLTVKEGTTLLRNPDLVNWVYQTANKSFTLPLINVGEWLRDRIDTVAQELGWMLMPPLPALSQMRSMRGNFDNIRSLLDKQGIHIPPEARGAYRDLEYEQGGFRLYAITWVLTETSEPEWTLLIALDSQPQTQMPRTLKLEIHDETQPLFSDTITDTNQGILYAQVIGNWNERFWITATADNEAVFEIPPFGIELEQTT